MRAVVDHRARRQEVIAKAIRLFARLGYRDVSFRELSEECGRARTVRDRAPSGADPGEGVDAVFSSTPRAAHSAYYTKCKFCII